MAASEPTELEVTGMTCANCAQSVTRALQRVPGVASADVSQAESRATVRWKPGVPARDAELARAVKEAGYEARPLAAGAEEPRAPAMEGWRLNVTLGAAATLPLIIGDWIFGWGMERWFEWLGFALATPVQVVGGARFYRGAWRQLKAGGSNMDTLVALGSTAAFGYSVWALLAGAAGHVYFMEAAAIITLISVGHWLEARAGARAESSLRALFQIAPPTARRRNADGSETETAAGELRAGDAVALRPGDRAPADGELREGHCSVNESMLTGESMPVEKEPGAAVYAGTIVDNGQGLMTVTATGDSTAVAQIIAAVKRAQNSRADIQRLADKVSDVFVPIVIAAAILTGLWWGLAPEAARRTHAALGHYLWAAHPPDGALAGAMMAAVAVLIVACPCAMGLATPIAIMAGANAGARRGILIRDGVALERAGQLTTVALDKTGTLTTGRPEPAAVDIIIDEAEELAAALARGSNHPLSRALAKLSPKDISLRDWREIPGGGVEAIGPDGARARLGSLAWLTKSGVDTKGAAAFAEKWSGEGATIVALAKEARLAAVFALRDTLKPGAAEAARRLQRMGLKVLMITGDSRRTAEAMARELGLAPDAVFAEVRPEDKAAVVRQLQEKGERVAFVGDGVNDGPALEQADLGIAVSRASDVAGEAADIALLQSDLGAIPEAIGLARAALRTIRQNLFWAFFYNAAAVPLAALGFMSPILCAAAMGLSDLVVIGNALRLSRWSRARE